MRQVAHALLTRPPLSHRPRHSEEIKSKCFARLACVKHAASVHPEPGSNSRKKVLSRSGKLLAFLSRYLLLASDLRFRSIWFPFWIFLLEIFRVVVYCSVIKVLFCFLLSLASQLKHNTICFSLCQYFFWSFFSFFQHSIGSIFIYRRNTICSIVFLPAKANKKLLSLSAVFA